jgi:hypothetical protein
MEALRRPAINDRCESRLQVPDDRHVRIGGELGLQSAQPGREQPRARPGDLGHLAGVAARALHVAGPHRRAGQVGEHQPPPAGGGGPVDEGGLQRRARHVVPPRRRGAGLWGACIRSARRSATVLLSVLLPPEATRRLLPAQPRAGSPRAHAPRRTAPLLMEQTLSCAPAPERGGLAPGRHRQRGARRARAAGRASSSGAPPGGPNTCTPQLTERAVKRRSQTLQRQRWPPSRVCPSRRMASLPHRNHVIDPPVHPPPRPASVRAHRAAREPHGKLVAQQEVLEHQVTAAAARGTQGREYKQQAVEHRSRMACNLARPHA